MDRIWKELFQSCESRDGAVLRALPSHQCGPGSIPVVSYHMWVEFVFGSSPCSEGFSLGTPVFVPPQIPTFPNSKSTWKKLDEYYHSVDVPLKFPFFKFSYQLFTKITNESCFFLVRQLHWFVIAKPSPRCT